MNGLRLMASKKRCICTHENGDIRSREVFFIDPVYELWFRKEICQEK